MSWIKKKNKKNKKNKKKNKKKKRVQWLSFDLGVAVWVKRAVENSEGKAVERVRVIHVHANESTCRSP